MSCCQKLFFDNSDKLVKDIQNQYSEIKSLSCIVNRRDDNVILDGKEILIAGKPYIEEELLGCKFRISARSFFQINPYATRVLYSTAIEYAQLTGKETLLDLYCGTGKMGIIGAKKAKKVYGIEIVADAILKIAPKNLVYVSCNLATLDRDVKILTDNGYQLEKVQPCDMFPQTVHVETVVLMSRVPEKGLK